MEIKIGDSVVVKDTPETKFFKNMKGVVVQNDDFDCFSLMVKLELVNKMQSIKKIYLTKT